MANGCGPKRFKIFLIVFNIIYLLSGFVMLAVGIWLRVDPSMVSLPTLISLKPDDKTLETGAYILITVGALIFLVGIWGCFVALRDGISNNRVYRVCLLIVLGTELCAGILVSTYKCQVVNELRETLTKNLKDNYVNGSIIAGGWDFVQLSFTCCGYDGYRDYVDSAYYNQSKILGITRPVPNSCCKLEPETNINDREFANQPACLHEAALLRAPGTFLNTAGCYDKILESINSKLPIVIGVAIGIGCLEVVAFILATCLRFGICEEYEPL